MRGVFTEEKKVNHRSSDICYEEECEEIVFEEPGEIKGNLVKAFHLQMSQCNLHIPLQIQQKNLK